MDYIVIWFILTGGFGYIPPQEVRKTDMSCGLEGQIIGVQIDNSINPSRVSFPDPGFANMHCVVNITKKVAELATLEPKEYHIATTIMGDGSKTFYYQHNPHTTKYFIIIKGAPNYPSKPGQFKLKGQQ